MGTMPVQDALVGMICQTTPTPQRVIAAKPGTVVGLHTTDEHSCMMLAGDSTGACDEHTGDSAVQHPHLILCSASCLGSDVGSEEPYK